LPYEDGYRVPAGYHVESRPQTGLIVTGAVAIGVGYAVGLGVGVAHQFEGSLGWLAVPIAGAWPAIGGRKVECKTIPLDESAVNEARKCLDNAYSEATTIAVIAVDGLVQTTGALLLLAGLLSGHSELVRDGARPVHVSARQRPEGGLELWVGGQF
jgi:hypothetical protein